MEEKTTEQSKSTNWMQTVAFILGGMGVVIIIVLAFIPPFNNHGSIDVELFSKYGAFIGGVVGPLFSLAGFLLLYKTLSIQKESFEQQNNAINLQKQSFEKERFETTLFNLINYKNDFVSKNAKDLFLTYHKGLNNIWTALSFEEYCEFSFSIEEALYKENDWNFHVAEINDHDTSEEEKEYHKYALSKISKRNEIEKYNQNFNIKKEDWDGFNNSNDYRKVLISALLLKNKFEETLECYFMLITEIIKHIDLNKHKSNEYIDILKTQISSLELSILFYYSFNSKDIYLYKRYNFFCLFENDNIKVKYLLNNNHYEIFKEIKPNTNS